MTEFESNAVLANRIAELQRENSKLQSERNELAATVEALRKTFPLKVLIGCDAHLNYPVSQYNDMVESFNANPQQHLRDIRAEAGRAGFIAGIQDWRYAELKYQDFNIEKSANQYAERVKEGE